MAKGKRFKKVKKSYKILIFILLIIIICSVIYIVNYFLDKEEVKEESNLLNTITVDKADITPEKTERMLQIEELKKKNSDIIGWIEIEGTNINYPVLQGEDNDFYMNRNYDKEESVYGALFLDAGYDWNIESNNFLIYGHNMQDGSMFNNLLNYADEEYYKEHPIIRFTTTEEDAEYEIISAFRSRVYYKSEKNVFRYYYFINPKTEKEYNEFVENAKEASLYDTGKTAEYGDQLITLSTCAYHTEDGRFAVIGRKINDK